MRLTEIKRGRVVIRNFPKLRLCSHIAALVTIVAGVQLSASGDRITFDGETWNDVLIYKSSTMYYVKVPDDGTIFNVPIDSVAPGSVEIVRDPWYRDDLKQRFEQNTAQGPRSSTEGVGTSVFNVSEIGTEEEVVVSEDATSEPGAELEAMEAAAAPAGPDPMESVKATLKAMQFKMANEDGDLVATSPDGATKIVFIGGTAEGGVEYSSTVPEANVQMQAMALGALGNIAGQAAPWAQEFLREEVTPLLQSGGSAEKSEGPLSITAEVTKADGNVTVNVAATPNAAT